MPKTIKTKTVYPHLGIIDEVEEIIEEECAEVEKIPQCEKRKDSYDHV